MKCVSPNIIGFGVKHGFFCIALSALLVACGSGSGEEENTRTIPNETNSAPAEDSDNRVNGDSNSQNDSDDEVDEPENNDLDDAVDAADNNNQPDDQAEDNASDDTDEHSDNENGATDGNDGASVEEPHIYAEIVALEDSNNDKHLPEWVLDGNLDEDSRWSAMPIDNNNPWIVFEFSDTVSLNQVHIKFFRGHLRTTSFRLETSSDRELWEVAAEFSSSGTATSFEQFNISEREARFLRFVGLGNSESLWSSVIELRIPNIGISTELVANTVTPDPEESEPPNEPSDPEEEEEEAPIIVEGDATVTVSSDQELSEAIKSGNYNNILIAPGNYTLADMAKGLDRSHNPLTIQAENPSQKPKFINATQSVELTRYVTFRNLSFESTNLPMAAYWFYDGGGSGNNRSANNIRILSCDFRSPDPGNKLSTTPNENYAQGMISGFRFSNWQTYNYTLQDISIDYAYSLGDFRMNGDVLIDNIRVNFWYFDGIRILGSGEEGYIDGDRVISNIDMSNNLAIYEEMDGRSSPHPDSTQMFNSGSSTNNTNPKIQNLLFYRNRFNPGQYRSNNTQSGLSQSYMINVGYIENLWATKQNPHGISIEGGASGVLIERNTLVDVNWADRPWIRIFRTDGQLIVADTYFLGKINTNNSFPNRAGYQLDQFNNDSSTAYQDFFQGPARVSGISSLVDMFTPKSSQSIGAINTLGAWRGGAHRPMRAQAPDISAVDKSFTINEIKIPSLQSPDQSSFGGDNYTRYDLRWSPRGRQNWTTKTNVHNGSSIDLDNEGIDLDGVEAVDIQTRCVNSAGEGLWSLTTTVTIN